MRAFKCDVCKRLFEGSSKHLQDMRFSVQASGFKLGVVATLELSADDLPDVCENCATGIIDLVEESLGEVLSAFIAGEKKTIKHLRPRLVEGEGRKKPRQSTYTVYGVSSTRPICRFCDKRISPDVPCEHLVRVVDLDIGHPTRISRKATKRFDFSRSGKLGSKQGVTCGASS